MEEGKRVLQSHSALEEDTKPSIEPLHNKEQGSDCLNNRLWYSGETQFPSVSLQSHGAATSRPYILCKPIRASTQPDLIC
ncbi:hypothetical protein EYF80_013650 [Liparis tanakae]|uniref:Uncharacterized protein n=1 Tax=Liparis tanakae TaxID=230148 RepID=A0A4Z2IDF8_9TELE|nr:hypothetical protein EYF80_013650 [Liparis tanakae]